jgi:type I restriction enzyme S subunit
MKTKSSQQNIPEGWNLIPAGEIFSFVRTYAFSRDNLINGTGNSHGIGNIHYGDIHSTYASSSIDLEKVSVPMIKDESFVPNNEDLLKDGDLVMADASEDYAGIGVTISLYGIGYKKVVGGLHTFVLRDTKGKTDKRFRQYIFRNPEIRNSLQKVANGVSVYGISKTEVSKIKIPLPSLSEQNRIVSVLETWDKSIEKLAQKIEAKKQVKKALMQDLLTGKKRLVGFNEKWKSVKLGDIATFKKGKGLPKSKIDSSGRYEAIHYGELFTKYNEYIETVISRTYSDKGMVLSERNDILMPTSDVTPRGLSTASYVEKDGVVLGGDILIIRSLGNLNGLFFCYIVSLNKKDVIKLVSGSTVFHLYGSDMAKFELKLPPLKEQESIVKILVTADKEISKLEKKLSILKEQKQYLLNNLITGTIRTPETLSTHT